MAERALRTPTYLAFFEHLVCMIAEADLVKNHQELGLQKIGSRSPEFRRNFTTVSPAAPNSPAPRAAAAPPGSPNNAGPAAARAPQP